jgi:hypothetical protein
VDKAILCESSRSLRPNRCHPVRGLPPGESGGKQAKDLCIGLARNALAPCALHRSFVGSPAQSEGLHFLRMTTAAGQLVLLCLGSQRSVRFRDSCSFLRDGRATRTFGISAIISSESPCPAEGCTGVRTDIACDKFSKYAEQITIFAAGVFLNTSSVSTCSLANGARTQLREVGSARHGQ